MKISQLRNIDSKRSEVKKTMFDKDDLIRIHDEDSDHPMEIDDDEEDDDE